MNVPEIDELLAATLDDRRLSRGERKAFEQVLADLSVDPQRLNMVSSRAFHTARQRLTDPRAMAVLEWLEDVIKAIDLVKSRHMAEQDIAEAHFAPGESCPTRVIELIRTAQKSIDVCVFTITDNRIARALQDAHRRRVAVRVITDNEKSYDLGSDAEELESSGIPVRYDKTPDHMHHKFAVFDQRLLLNGSYNWTRSASEVNFENIMVTSQRSLVQVFSTTFQELWERLG
jgi:phosphatidylserine/phosphatidylglycerophosphate/cardiolipin synthase-like enzyme